MSRSGRLGNSSRLGRWASANSGDAQKMTNVCTSNPAMTDPAAGASWNGWALESGTPDSRQRLQQASRGAGSGLETEVGIRSSQRERNAIP
jgi:hypothetical protein